MCFIFIRVSVYLNFWVFKFSEANYTIFRLAAWPWFILVFSEWFLTILELCYFLLASLKGSFIQRGLWPENWCHLSWVYWEHITEVGTGNCHTFILRIYWTLWRVFHSMWPKAQVWFAFHDWPRFEYTKGMRNVSFRYCINCLNIIYDKCLGLTASI